MIPFSIPSLVGNEADYVSQALSSGALVGDGPFGKRCQALLEEGIGAAKALLTTSCTSALEMTALLLDVREGDEVIMPAFTFVSCPNAFVLRGARPVFCDIREDTLNLDEKCLERLVTPRTKGVLAVHYAGVACDMDAIGAVAGAHGLSIIEDNAHGLFGTYRGRQLGTFGRLATLSFHQTKNFTCGEGGALLINDPALIERAEIIREKGTDRSRFYRGQIDKYTWIDIGSSYVPSDLLAALLLGQLEKRHLIQDRRRRIWDRYLSGLAGWAADNDVRMPFVPAECNQAFHMFYLRLPSLEERQRFIAYLAKREIMAVFHYLPLHLSTMGLRFGGRPGDCPVTERVADTLVRLPFYTGLSDEDQDRVIEAVSEYRVGVGR